MGLFGWYPKFVPTLLALLTDLMTLKRKFGLTKEAIKAFSKLKECLRSCVVRISRSRLQYLASKSGLGAVLVLLSEECPIVRPIAFVSMKLNKAQINT